MTVAFVLSGGGNLGALQAGAMRALLEAGVVPDLLVGSSVGALNAAFYAGRPGTSGCDKLEAAWADLGRRDLFRFELSRALRGFLGLRDHLVRSHRLEALVRQWLPFERIEEAEVPFAVMATDVLTGESVLLRRGDVVASLLASSAIPGIFPPVRLGERWLVDGSLSAGCPIAEAFELGATDVYVVTTGTAPRSRPPRGAVAMAMHSVSLATVRLQRVQFEEAVRVAAARGGTIRVVPSAKPDAPSPFNFGGGRALAAMAYGSARWWIEQGAPDVVGLTRSLDPEPGAPDGFP